MLAERAARACLAAADGVLPVCCANSFYWSFSCASMRLALALDCWASATIEVAVAATVAPISVNGDRRRRARQFRRD